jgi:hypothetical protein
VSAIPARPVPAANRADGTPLLAEEYDLRRGGKRIRRVSRAEAGAMIASGRAVARGRTCAKYLELVAHDEGAELGNWRAEDDFTTARQGIQHDHIPRRCAAYGPEARA